MNSRSLKIVLFRPWMHVTMQLKQTGTRTGQMYSQFIDIRLGLLYSHTVTLISRRWCRVYRGVARIFGLGGRRYHVRRSLTERAPKLWSPCGVSGSSPRKKNLLIRMHEMHFFQHLAAAPVTITITYRTMKFKLHNHLYLLGLLKKSVLFALGGHLPPCPL